MEIVEKIFFAFLGASLSASIVIGIVVIILKLFNNGIGIRVKNILWLVVLIKLLIPIVPQTNINLLNFLHTKNHALIQSESVKHDLSNTKVPYTFIGEHQSQRLTYSKEVNMSNKNKIDNENFISAVLKIISGIWVIGIFIFALVFLFAEISARKKFSGIENNSCSKLEELIEDYKIKANIGMKIPVFLCDNFKSPCIAGIIKPKIYIPRSILDINDKNQLSYVILHELIHYKRKDLFCNFLGIIAVSIHWFNPVVWFAVNKMKIYREYACDFDVLGIIGEKETINYGMSIINVSKIFSNQNKNSYLAVFFETKNQTKGRIEMIKKFKKSSHKKSVAAALCCAMAATAVFTNGITVNGMDGSNTKAINTSVSTSDKSTFLIDSQIKHYSEMNKAEKITGFKFKVPGYLPTGYKESLGANVVKLGANDNAFETGIQCQTGKDKGEISSLHFKVFKGDPVVAMHQLKTIECIDGHLINGKSGNANVKVKAHGTPMSTKKLDGVDIDVSVDYPAKPSEEAFSQHQKYFAWKNDGIWYALEYKFTVNANGKTKDRFNIPISDISDIAASIVYPGEQKNVSYADKEELSTELGIMNIYDKDDLKKAEKFLGFNAKFPLKVDKNINIIDSNLGISGDSDVKNNKIYYQLLNFYSFKGGSITFSQSKSPADIKKYDDMKRDGYIVETDEESKKTNKIKAEDLNIQNTDVMKYENSIFGGDINYTWKENGVIYYITVFGKLNNADEAAKVFVMSKGVN